MVFELTDSLINKSVLDDKNIRASLHNLFLGYEEGNLLLSVSPALLDFLDEGLTDSLSKRVINYLRHRVFARYAVKWQIKVVLKNPNFLNHELSIDFFKSTSTIQPPILLCENLNDAIFYFALCEDYFGIDFINTKNKQGGGGSSTADNLEQIVKGRDRFCLCIVDSDIKYSGCCDGGTYIAIQNKKLQPHPSFYVHKLSVHEVENLIPIDSIYKHVPAQNHRRFAQRLKMIDQGGDILKYYDIKDGIKLSSIQQDLNYYTFAEEIYNRLSRPSKRNPFSTYISAISNNAVFPHLCPGALEAFLRDQKTHGESFSYCDYLRVEWEGIKDLIVAFFCARNDDPIN